MPAKGQAGQDGLFMLDIGPVAFGQQAVLGGAGQVLMQSLRDVAADAPQEIELYIEKQEDTNYGS